MGYIEKHILEESYNRQDADLIESTYSVCSNGKKYIYIPEIEETENKEAKDYIECVGKMVNSAGTSFNLTV